MEKRSRIRPRNLDSHHRAKTQRPDVTAAYTDDIRDSLRKAGLLPAFEALSKQWFPYVEKKVSSISGEQSVELSASRNVQLTLQQFCASMCFALALFQLRQRAITLNLARQERGSQAESTAEIEAAAVVADCIRKTLSGIMGNGRAKEMFRKLDTITEQVLKASGKPR